MLLGLLSLHKSFAQQLDLQSMFATKLEAQQFRHDTWCYGLPCHGKLNTAVRSN